MKITSQLNPASVPGFCNGTLQMRFAAPKDWDPKKGWKVGLDTEYEQTFPLGNSGASIYVHIIPFATPGSVGSLKLKFDMHAQQGGQEVAKTLGPLDTDSLTLRPKKTAPDSFAFLAEWSDPGKPGRRFGAWLDVRWNGIGAQCLGLWWATW